MYILLASSEKSNEWSYVLQAAVVGYNMTFNSAVHDAPDEVLDNQVVMFMIAQDNARRLQHNQSLHEKRVDRLKEAGGFRRPVGARKFKRGFRATYGDVEEPTAIEGSRVESTGGAPIDIKLVSIVEKDSTKATPKFATGDGRLESTREMIEDFIAELRGYLEIRDGRASTSASAAHLKKQFPEYFQLLKAARVESLADAVRLFPQLFELDDDGRYIVAV